MCKKCKQVSSPHTEVVVHVGNAATPQMFQLLGLCSFYKVIFNSRCKQLQLYEGNVLNV